MGGTCGVVTGAFMIIGLKFGGSDVQDKELKARTYGLVKRFAAEFEARNGSITCRDLPGFDIGFRDKISDSGRIISQRCPGFVRDSIAILENIFTEQK